MASLFGKDWRDMRSTLSPAFTGNKMRQMFELISHVGRQSTETLKKEIEGTGKVLEMREFISKFALDVIATCAFGLEVDSFKNPDNYFENIARDMVSFASQFNPQYTIFFLFFQLNFTSFKAGAKLMGYITFPKLMTFLKVKIIDQKVIRFFKETILDVMDEREKRGIIRHDLINILIEARKGQLIHEQKDEMTEGFATVEESEIGKSKINRVWSDTDLAAQAFIFLLAGFDTVTTAMSFASYELAVNSDVQEKLIQEIDDLKSEEITYEKIRDMKYMDQFISEALRKWPPASALDRKCLKNYLLEYDNKSVVIEKDSTVFFPIIGYHFDPKYFPEPEKFDPERFSDENKGNINLDVYLPFGIGPRNCIGSRFALMELKTIFFYLLSNFKLEVCEKTQVPLKYAKSPFAVRAEKGIWLNLKPRV